MILGFKDQFIEPINQGIKIHSIREDKNDLWNDLRRIDFFRGVRTKSMKRFRDSQPCTGTQGIIIFPEERVVCIIRFDYEEYQLSDSEIEELAKNDGFDSVEDFWNWFNKYFSGKIIHWTDFRY